MSKIPSVIKLDYNEYLKSEIWKCGKSPTGAHYSVGTSKKIVCKYCGKIQILDDSKSPSTLMREKHTSYRNKRLYQH